MASMFDQLAQINAQMEAAEKARLQEEADKYLEEAQKRLLAEEAEWVQRTWRANPTIRSFRDAVGVPSRKEAKRLLEKHGLI